MLQAVQGAHSSSAALADLQFEVQFEGDSISLELPEDGVVLPNGWTIRPLGPLAVSAYAYMIIKCLLEFV